MSMIERCRRMDMGFSGPTFPWSNMRQGWESIQCRLDRSYCNSDWLSMFPECVVPHLAKTKSDHCPIFLHLRSSLNHKGGIF